MTVMTCAAASRSSAIASCSSDAAAASEAAVGGAPSRGPSSSSVAPNSSSGLRAGYAVAGCRACGGLLAPIIVSSSDSRLSVSLGGGGAVARAAREAPAPVKPSEPPPGEVVRSASAAS